jgi:TolB-like protein/DNA-binding winged helix-turn-helix (wHTH) protein/Tfp pilus assembly protein PilF
VSSETGVLRFGAYELETPTAELRKAGRKLKIQPQPFKVLAYLVSRPGELVTREELREAVWGSETYVDFEQGLNYCVRQIRAVLGEDADKPKYIETLPKRGYRFIAAVEHQAAELHETSETHPRKRSAPRWQIGVGLASAATALAFLLWASTGLVRSADTTVAVLAFADLSAENNTEYFAHGLTEELISRLSGVGGLRVVGRASAFALPPNSDFHQAADRLGVRNLLTGSVRRQDNRVRVTVQLVDAQEDRTLWSESYDRKLSDVLAVQEEIAHSVVSTLKERFGIHGAVGRPLNRPSNIEAYNLYLRALYVGRNGTSTAMNQAMAMLERVIQMEPQFAAAQAHLAHFKIRSEISGITAPDPDRFNRAKAVALKAAALEPASADAQMVLGYAAMRQFHWREAKARLEEALRLDPSHSRARDLRASVHIIHGEVEDSMRESQRAVELDPLSPLVNRDRGLFQYLARRYDDALRSLQEVQQLNPEFPWAYHTATFVHLQKGNCPEAMASSKKHLSIVGVPTLAVALATTTCVGPDAGQKALEDVYRTRQYFIPAPDVHLALRDRERGLRELEAFAEQPLTQQLGSMWFLKVDPRFDSLRGDPRFQAVLRKLGLN